MAKLKKIYHKVKYKGRKNPTLNSDGLEGPASNRGLDLIYGKHAVLSALANSQRQINRLLLTLKSYDSLHGKIEQALCDGGHSKIKIVTLDRRNLDNYLPPGAVHQGIALEIKAQKKIDLEDIINQTSGDAEATIIILDQATDTYNIGSILRSAAAFGAVAIIMQDRNSPVINGSIAKAASGALEHVAVVRTTNLVRAMDKLKAAEYWCIGLDGKAKQTLLEAKLTGRVALVLGSEGSGLRRLTRENCDTLVKVPTNIESLNLSNAAAIALYEKTRK